MRRREKIELQSLLGRMTSWVAPWWEHPDCFPIYKRILCLASAEGWGEGSLDRLE